MKKKFLPYNQKTFSETGWVVPDFVLVTGDGYVDHPSFGAAIIGRVLESRGFKTAILSQPDINKSSSFSMYGRPRLGFLVTGGNIDSMVAHYTVNKRIRHDDKYTPGNRHGKRPDRAVTVYCRKIRDEFGDIPVIIGGIEASLRRLGHYDYWKNEVMPSVLLDSTADILVYGMGERAITEIAMSLNDGEDVSSLVGIRGTAYCTDGSMLPKKYLELPSYECVKNNRKAYAEMTRIMMDNADHIKGSRLVQAYENKNCYVVVNKPSLPLSEKELDKLYELPFVYDYPEEYHQRGGIKALEEVKFSITHNRGCFGNCNFCSIALHQGRFVTSRSHQSVLNEATMMTNLPGFKGYIHDVGGATANFRHPGCEKQKKRGFCTHRRCLYPDVCKEMKVDHGDYRLLLKEIRSIPGIKKVFIRSGIRYDYLLADSPSGQKAFLDELVKYHVSGQLRVAPEHSESGVLKAMGKPDIEKYDRFVKAFDKCTKAAGKEQYVLPYLISSHPGCTLSDAVSLMKWMKKRKIHVDQVQDFYPTPGAVSTCMFYTGINPYTMEKIYVPRSVKEKRLQRALMQYNRKENQHAVREALDIVGRK